MSTTIELDPAPTHSATDVAEAPETAEPAESGDAAPSEGVAATDASAELEAAAATAAAESATAAADAGRAPPDGLDGLAYASGDVPLIVSAEQPPYVRGAVGTPPAVGELAAAGGANVLNAGWQEMVRTAAGQNGGLGNAEDGYLAFSKEHGFVRLKHPGLTPEQNRRMAEISLQTGWPVESLPCRTDRLQPGDPEIQEWTDSFIGKFDAAWAGFKADPEAGIHLKDGKRRYALEFNEEAGGFVSYDWKKAGGLKGFVQDHMKIIGPVLNGLSIAANVVPGIGQAASAAIAVGVQALKTGVNYLATGALRAKDLVSTAIAAFVPGGLKGAAPETLAAAGAANVAAEAIDTGKLSANGLLNAALPLVPGLPGGATSDLALRGALGLAADAIDQGKLGATDFYEALAPLLFGADRPADQASAGGVFDALGRGLGDGTLSAADAAIAAKPLFDVITGGDARANELLKHGLAAVVHGIDSGKLHYQDLLHAAGPYLGELLGSGRAGRAAAEALELAALYADRGKVSAARAQNLFELVFDVDLDRLKDDFLARAGVGKAA